MNKKLKALTFALGLVYLLFSGYSVYTAVPQLLSGFKYGWNSNSPSDSNSYLNKQYVYFKVTPKSEENRFPITVKEVSGRQLNVGVDQMEMELVDVRRSVPAHLLYWVVVLLSLSLLFVVLYIPYQVFKVFYGTIRQGVFKPDRYKIFNKIGIAVIYFYVIVFSVNLVNYIDAKNQVALQDYDVTIDFSEGVYILLLGLFSLFFAEILKIATHIKEENDLTV